ncbi:MAG: MmcB family DNA repair protein [Pseudomonadota bacterium]
MDIAPDSHHISPDTDALSGDRALTQAVARGVCRHLIARGQAPLLEFSLGNGRRADVAAVDEKGRITIVEIKVSVSDFRGDGKWQEYLGYCDAFYFAVPQSFPAQLLDETHVQPERTGVMIADKYDAVITREAAHSTLPGARRKAENLRFARKAALRLQTFLDPEFTG